MGLAPSGGSSVRQADLRTHIRPSVAEVDLSALRRNVARLRAILGPGVALYGVVKADAYGHGAVVVGRALAPLCDALAVSLVEEGLELRNAGIDVPVLVLGAYYGGCHSEVIEEGLTPVVYDVADLDQFASTPVRRRPRRPHHPGAGERVDLHLKIDTGMNRLGFAPSALADLAGRLDRMPRLRVQGLCTHFASADMQEPEPTQAQLELFRGCLTTARGLGLVPDVVHAANSAAAVRFPEARFGAVRPGLALYGTMPSPVVPCPGLEPTLALRTRVMAMHEVAAGQGVSYGGWWRAPRASRVATLPMGYADGYPRHVRGAEVLLRGRRVPVVGTVCMDMMMIEVTDVPGASVGDVATMIGRDGDEVIAVDDVAAWAGTLAYEILCGISKRVPRLYHDDVSASAGEGS